VAARTKKSPPVLRDHTTAGIDSLRATGRQIGLRELLERYNPLLVMYPQDPARDRPGAFRPRKGWGDYHPCNAEFFLDRAVRRDCPEQWDYVSALLSRFSAKDSLVALQPDRLQPLRGFIGASRPDQSGRWELDVCEIPSQDPPRAWAANQRFLAGSPTDGEPFRCTVYARCVGQPGGKALQYWYLYVYNDFLNHHEGDWEMVTIALDPNDQPTEVAYSNHHGGVRRAWQDAPREGDRPLVYVARGSHAGYFRYASGGHALVGDLSTGKPPPALFFLKPARQLANHVIRVVQRVPGIRLFRDNPPADPILDTGHAPPEKIGERVSPEVLLMPDGDDFPPDSDAWWMRYRGFWGSTRPRVLGSVGVIGPWASNSPRDTRWREPLVWLQSCKLDKGAGTIARAADAAGEAVGDAVDRVAEEVKHTAEGIRK